ncbi:hypothetical protein DP149_10240 [Clostridium tetani]|uniref:hypothetical protein n=2 Tax=Clostridium tetani TaxID=1513 RepID=UPI000322EFAF|nr:hypothetical protein [Clostridium tetani]KGI37949.1 hypothetical protein KY52_10485 [Clostridium tetani]KGI45328.1 hypothetical protein KY54_04275 [Clostridium tetani]KHO31950.1 hypothetical protein OR63_07910 [Clostridium tetani]KIG22133.1 hypothetical protein RS78_00485 [Clostridium tetani]RXI62104.1 hypothetical protein DP125_04810 [Clostridium tetani]
MVELMTYVSKLLSFCCDNVYFEDLERDTEGVINIDDINLSYELESGSMDAHGFQEHISLVINVWGRNDQIIPMEDMVKLIDKQLLKRQWNCDGRLYVIDRDVVYRNNIKDPDRRIRRIKLNYIVQII